MRRSPSKPTKKKSDSSIKNYLPDSLKPKKPAMSITKQTITNKKTGTKTLMRGVPLKYKK